MDAELTARQLRPIPAAEALREAEARFREAFDNAPIGMALIEPAGRYLLVNRALCELLGRSEKEMLSTTWMAVTYPPDLDADTAYANRLLAGEIDNYQIEKRYVHSDGHPVQALLSVSLARDGAGTPLYFISQIQDISERKRAEEEVRRRNAELAALHQTTLGVLERLDPTDVLEAILSRAATLMSTEHGYLYVVDKARDELVVRAGTGVFVEYQDYRLKRGEGLAGRVWETGETLAVDDYHVWSGRRPGFDFIRAAVGLPLRAGREIVGVIGLAHIEPGPKFGHDEIDLLGRFGHLASLALENARLFSEAQQELVERKRAEKELERYAAELERANRDLRAADELKSHFVAVVSHELRTPLTSVLGFAATILKHWGTMSDEEKREHVATIEEQGRRLARLVEDLLTMSRIEAGVLDTHPEALELAEAIRQGLKGFGTRASRIKVSCPDDLRVFADPHQLQEILENYADNALKYGEPPVEVAARAVGDWIELTVCDSGEGIPEDFVPRLFEKFAQASVGPARQGEGTGLGLSIVRGLARAQGGEAWYQPNYPKGACFCVRLRPA